MMNPKFSHPYKDHSEPYQWDDDKIDDIDELHEWWVVRLDTWDVFKKFDLKWIP